MNFRDLPYFQHIKWNPTRTELRHFAIAMLIGFAVLGLLSLWRQNRISQTSIVLWIVGVTLALASQIPVFGRIVYLVVMLPSSFIGYFVSKVVLFLIFFLVFVPTGLLVRLIGKDLLRLRPKAPRAIWVATNSDKGADRYYRQF